MFYYFVAEPDLLDTLVLISLRSIAFSPYRSHADPSPQARVLITNFH
jgi:hypothetical protein